MTLQEPKGIWPFLPRLYSFPASSRWMMANSALFQDIVILRRSPGYGSRGRVIRKLVGLSSHWGTLLLLVRLVGLIDVTRWWRRAGRQAQVLPTGCRAFIGFGAGSEEQMWRNFVGETDVPAVRLDQTQAATFGQYYRPTLWALWTSVWRQSREMLDFLSNTTVEPVATYRPDFVTFATMRLAQYVFFLHWWKGVEERIKQAAFISPDTQAFACLDAGFPKAEFRQHGLLRRSVLMPSFPEMQILTEEERDYYSTLLPDTKITVVESPLRVEKHRPLLLFASIYNDARFSKEDDLGVLESLLSWAHAAGVRVVVRRHPREQDGFWDAHFPQLEIDKENDAFEEALLRLRPMFVVTWFSTVLIDALRCNVIPVSISKADNPHVRDLVVSLSDHCLLWPDKRALLEDVARGSIAAGDVVRELSRAQGAGHGA